MLPTEQTLNALGVDLRGTPYDQTLVLTFTALQEQRALAAGILRKLTPSEDADFQIRGGEGQGS
jgi:hypothetical protein